MKADVLRNLRLVAATTLLSLWGCSQLAAASAATGYTMLLLFAALAIAPSAGWHGARRFVAIAALAFVLLTAALYLMGSEQALQSFASSPWFVVPVWLLAAFGLVRNAISAERSAAAAHAASVAARATDAG